MTARIPEEKKLGFAAQIAKEKLLVYDLRVVLNGDPCYFIIKVLPAKRQAFVRAVAEDTGFQLEDYGEILHRGLDAPSEALKAQLREQYGMYEDE